MPPRNFRVLVKFAVFSTIQKACANANSQSFMFYPSSAERKAEHYAAFDWYRMQKDNSAIEIRIDLAKNRAGDVINPLGVRFGSEESRLYEHRYSLVEDGEYLEIKKQGILSAGNDGYLCTLSL